MSTLNPVNLPQYSRRNSGFTLVELSIVLVIIGLIVGGVLVGQDLIRAAENRAIVTQIQKYNTSMNTFRVKYNALPGDYSAATSYLSITGFTGFAALANGDGNGIVHSVAGVPAAVTTIMTGEIVQFWEQLTVAGMMDGAMTGLATTTTLGTNFPYSKSNRGGIILYGLPDGYNYFQIGLASTTATTTVATSNILRPEEALAIDSKMDDGLPESGSVQALGGAVLNAADTAGAAGGAFCTNTSATPSAYNVTQTGPQCQLRLRAN